MTTPLAPPNSQSLASALGRDWVLRVRELGGSESDWLFVRGCSSLSPIFEGAEQDASDIDGEGYDSSVVTGLSWRVEGGCKRKGEATAGFVDDPGQALLRRKGRKTGIDNMVEFQIYRRDDLPDAYKGSGPVIWKDNAAGDPKALQDATFTLKGNGKPEDIAKPTGTPLPTAKVITLPAGLTGGTWSLTVGSATASGLAHNAASSAVQTAVLALAGVPAGTTVTGSAGGPYTVTFAGPVGAVSASGSSLTPAGTVSVS